MGYDMVEAISAEEMSDEEDERDRNKAGQYVESVTPEMVLDLFAEVEGPVLASTDVREQYKVTSETANRKFQELERRGLVGSRVIGGRTVYWRTEEDE
jgi:Fic family protein